jgi:NAD(P)-dependent dehydrogenase (short-subunit alcohol dehydrogenase family)
MMNRRALVAIMLMALWVATSAAQERPKNILITGSTDGLGREVARRMAATGAHVIVHGRNRARGDSLVEEIRKGGKGSAKFYAADLASLAEVRKLADAILRDYDRLDVLVNNAGIWLQGNERQLSADQHELTFAVNYLAGFLLTQRLLPRLIAAAPARIVNVASLAQSPVDFSDPMMERNYSGGRAYSQSKLAQVMHAFDLAKELQDKGVTVNALHPATMMNTTMVQKAGGQPRSTVDQGADAVVNLITAPGIGTGQYFNGLNPARANAQAYDESAREKLRTLAKLLTGTM